MTEKLRQSKEEVEEEEERDRQRNINLRGKETQVEKDRSERGNTGKMSLPNSVLESRVIITALATSIMCLGKLNLATANFSSSLLKLLSASWLAESEDRETEMGNGTVLWERRQKKTEGIMREMMRASSCFVFFFDLSPIDCLLRLTVLITVATPDKLPVFAAHICSDNSGRFTT